MRVYKITTQELTTHKGFQWEVGKQFTDTIWNPKVCANGGFHCYHSPYLAVLMNPAHGSYIDYKLWLAEGEGEFTDDKDKLKFHSLTLIEEVEIPEFTTNQKIYFGILATLEVCKEEEFVTWAENWISGKDRSKESAVYAAYNADAADAAADAADAAADAAAYAAAYNAADAAVYAAVYAADAAVYAAVYAVVKERSINLAQLAEKTYNWVDPVGEQLGVKTK